MSDINKEVMNKIADKVTSVFLERLPSNTSELNKNVIASIAEIASAVVLEYHNEIKRLDE